MMPIGPAPVISTSSPSTWNESAVCTALPKGSKIGGHVVGDALVEWTQTLVMGRARYSAKAPGRFTPTPLVSAQRWRRPARQLRQRPQTTWPSPLTISPGWKSADVGADLDDLAHELVADHHRHGDGLLRPGVPVVDVQVGAADAGAVHADQHVVDADRWAPGRPRARGRARGRLLTSAFMLSILAQVRRFRLPGAVGPYRPGGGGDGAGPDVGSRGLRPERPFRGGARDAGGRSFWRLGRESASSISGAATAS